MLEYTGIGTPQLVLLFGKAYKKGAHKNYLYMSIDKQE